MAIDMRTREGRAIRETQTREADARPEVWKPNALLPDPTPRDGIVYRWVRTSVRGQVDTTNVSARFREGWQPVRKEDVPELSDVITDHNSRFPENIEIGGLLLCRIDQAIAHARQRHYEEMARNQVRASENNLMREADRRMPLHKPEVTSRTTFGSGNAPR